MYPNNTPMDPTANLALQQQNWNQWQAYQQQLAQWQAQYGEQYQREMLQKMGYNNAATSSFAPQGYPSVVQPPMPHQQPPMPFAIQQPAPPPLPVSHHHQHLPHPPPPSSMPQHQPAPPPPPPEPTTTESANSFNQQNHSFHAPPPPTSVSKNNSNGGGGGGGAGRNGGHHHHHNAVPTSSSDAQHQQNLAAIPPSNEEIAFDEQFKKWEDEFNNWKRLNANHPDRVAYVDYETKMEQCRSKLLERREQMRQRKLRMLLERETEAQLQQQQQLHHHQPTSEPSGAQQHQHSQQPQEVHPSQKQIREPPQYYQIPEQTSFTLVQSNAGIPGLDLIHNNDDDDDDGREHSTALDEEEQEPAHHNLIDTSEDESMEPSSVKKTKSSHEDTQKTSNLEAISMGINHILGDPSFLSMLSNLNPVSKPAPVVSNSEVTVPQQQHQPTDHQEEPCEYNPDYDEDDQYQSEEYNEDPYPYDEDADNEAPPYANVDPEDTDRYQQQHEPTGYDQTDDTQDPYHGEESEYDQFQDAENYNQENVDNFKGYNHQPPEDDAFNRRPLNQQRRNPHDYQLENRASNEPSDNHFGPANNGQPRNNGRQQLQDINPQNHPVEFRPRQVINYDNVPKKQPSQLLRASSVGGPPNRKVFDYSHQSNAAYFKPRRFVDYGHGSQFNRGGGGGVPPAAFEQPSYNNNNNNSNSNNHILYHRPAPVVSGGGGSGLLAHPPLGTPMTNFVNNHLIQGGSWVNNKMRPTKANRIVQNENPNLVRPTIQKESTNTQAPSSRTTENEQSPSNIPQTGNPTSETMASRNTVRVEDILFEPGRSTRPQKIIIIMRGPPGSGKSHLAKKIKDVEHNRFKASVRILSIDDYFISENEDAEDDTRTEKASDPVYKYDASQEQTYAGYLMKSFKKTVTDGLFEFIIVDATNAALAACSELYNFGKQHGFTPYACELLPSAQICFERNIHQRSLNDIEEIVRAWQPIPDLYLRLNVDDFMHTATSDN